MWNGERPPKPSRPTQRERPVNGLGYQVGGEPLVERPERDIFPHRRGEQLVVGVLEDEADHAPHPLEVLLFHLDAHHLDATLAGEYAVQVEHQGGFTRAVGPHYRNRLSLHHLEVDAVQCGCAVWIAVGEAFDSYRDRPVEPYYVHRTTSLPERAVRVTVAMKT